MKKFEEKAIPLIFRNQSKKYEVNPDAIKLFQSIQGKIAIISIAGIYRTGKSYLLNTILLKQKAGFAVGPTTNPKTKGIWVWGKPLILKNQKDQIINVCVVDSQGLGSIQEDVNHDLRLFSLTLLISSMFIYNTLGAIDQHAIDSLGLVLRLCERLKSQSYNDLPDFYWVLRDFSLALVGRDNQPLTPDKYLQQSLSPQPGDSQNRNKIRQSIRSSFPQRHCYTFVRPLTNQEQLQKLDTLQIDQLRPEFMEQVIDFRKLINSSIRTKKIKGKQISAQMLLELIKVYTAEINGQQLPQIETGWKYVCARECQQALNLVEKQAEEIINKMLDSLPTTKKDLNQKRDALYESLKKLFESRTSGNDQAQSFIPELNRIIEKKINKVQDQMKLKNIQETKLYIKKQFENNVQKRLKAGEFKSMGELAKQFQVFYQFYRKKCPYKDQIQIGLECLLKKFSDCSVLFHKGFKTRKDQEITKLRQELDRITHQLQVREQRNKHQRTAGSDKLAVLQSKIQQLNRQNRQLSQQLLKSQVQLQRFKRDQQQNGSKVSQEIQLQLICLKKQLMNAEQLVRQAQCMKNLEISNCCNQLLLKQNEIKNILEEKESLHTRVNNLNTQLSNSKQEKNRKIQELFQSLQNLKATSNGQLKVLEQKLKNSQQNNINLQNLLEIKNNQVRSVIKKQQTQLKNIYQNFEADRIKVLQTKCDQIKSLKEGLQNQQQGAVLKIRRMQAEYAQKQMELKMHKLQVERQTAIINQKLQFLKRQCAQKEEKINKLQEENSCYLNMFEEKDNELSNLNTFLDQSRVSYESFQTQATQKIEQTSQIIQQKMRQIARLQQVDQRLTAQIREKQQDIKQLQQKLKIQNKTSEQKIKQLNDRLQWSQNQAQRQRRSLQQELQILRAQNSKMTDDQKRTAQLSLVQLKNYYEMERERLQKRNLQDRKKHQTLEVTLTNDLQNKHRKAIRAVQQQLNNIKLVKDQLQQNLVRSEADAQQKIQAIQQERQCQRKKLENKTQLLEKKYQELQNQFDLFQRNYEEERISFVKRMQGLNFELSRKQKQLMQLNSKREALQHTLSKKQAQLDSTKKMMNQEIELSMKKVSQFQQKYQKLNEEYMKFRMQTQKELALTKQKNEFQANKLNQLQKQKEIGSTKTIERLDKQRFGDLKEQNQKLKNQLLALQGKFQALRKSAKQQQSNIKKQYATLERDYEFLQQKNNINQAKIAELQNKISQKIQIFSKQSQELKIKQISERQAFQKQIQALRQKIADTQEDKSQSVWTLQKDITLLNEKIKYLEYQKDTLKRQQEENERKLSLVTNQLRKASEKASQDSEARKLFSDKKYTSQIEQLKQSLRSKSDQYQEILRKQREELRIARQKNLQQAERIQAFQRIKNDEKSYLEEIQSLKKEKQALINNYRADKQKQIDQWKKKYTELQKKNKQMEAKAMHQIFQSEKDSSKWSIERQSMIQQIKSLQEGLEWQKNKNLVKSKTELKKSQSSTFFGYGTDYGKHSWK